MSIICPSKVKNNKIVPFAQLSILQPSPKEPNGAAMYAVHNQKNGFTCAKDVFMIIMLIKVYLFSRNIKKRTRI